LPTQPGIFISYRREDASGHAGRLYDRLSARFGAERVFIDVDALEPGGDFVEGIEEAVGSAGVMLAVIGLSWTRVKDKSGRRRLDDPNDFVRREVAGALESKVRVIPVLVQGATMPAEDELPAPLAPLSRRSALELRDTDYNAGVDKLARFLEPLIEPQKEPELEPEPPPAPKVPPLAMPVTTAIIGLIGSALLGIGLILLQRHLLDHRFPGTIVPSGVIQGPAAIAVLAGCLIGALVIWGKGLRASWLALGLLLGFGFAAAVKGVSLMGEPQTNVRAGAWLWLIGGVVVMGGGVVSLTPFGQRVAALRKLEPEHPSAGLTVLLLLSAGLMIAGAVVPFAVVGGETRTIVGHTWWAVDPIGLAAAVLIALLLLFGGLRTISAGILIALGIAGTLLYFRYVGVPFLQWVNKDDPPTAGVRAGACIGGLGAFLVLLTGWSLARGSRPVAVPTAGPTPLPAN